MKYQTDFGELEIEEIIRCCNLWKHSMARNNEKRFEFNQTEQGKTRNRTNAKSYYQRHKEEILAKRKAAYEAKKETPQFVD